MIEVFKKYLCLTWEAELIVYPILNYGNDASKKYLIGYFLRITIITSKTNVKSSYDISDQIEDVF